MWVISKEFHFSASHQLTGLPDNHQCARLHGHNYILVVKLESGQLIEPGFVLDYGELSFVKNMVDAMDHRHLNDLFAFNPTSERIIHHLYAEVWKQLMPVLRSKFSIDGGTTPVSESFVHAHYQLHVGLSETPKTWAWYTHDPSSEMY